VIGVDGTTKPVSILEGIHRDLDKAATAALKATRWTPAQKNGQPIEVQVVVPIQFKLEAKPSK